MIKTGETYIQSREKRALELSILGVCAPFIGAVGLGAAGIVCKYDSVKSLTTKDERSLVPGEVFRMRKLGSVANDHRALNILRKAMLDELPQTATIAAGRMSLIGPRAASPAHVERLYEAIPDRGLADEWLYTRSKQKAGIISSYAIASHSQNLEGLPEHVRYAKPDDLVENSVYVATLDVHDFEHASMYNDITLLQQTARMVTANYKAYAERRAEI